MSERNPLGHHQILTPGTESQDSLPCKNFFSTGQCAVVCLGTTPPKYASRQPLSQLNDGGVDIEHPWHCGKDVHDLARAAMCVGCFQVKGHITKEAVRRARKKKTKKGGAIRKIKMGSSLHKKVQLAIPNFDIHSRRLPNAVCSSCEGDMTRLAKQRDLEANGAEFVDNILSDQKKIQFYRSVERVQYLLKKKITRSTCAECPLCSFAQEEKEKARRRERKRSNPDAEKDCDTRDDLCQTNSQKHDSSSRKKPKNSGVASTEHTSSIGQILRCTTPSKFIFTSDTEVVEKAQAMYSPQKELGPDPASKNGESCDVEMAAEPERSENADIDMTDLANMEEMRDTACANDSYLYSVKDMITSQILTRSSNQQLIQWAHIIRHVAKDRKIIEPGLQQALIARNKKFQEFFDVKQFAVKRDEDGNPTKDEKGNEHQGRAGVFCNDIPGFVKAVLEERAKTLNDLKMMKVGIDGGRGSLKVCSTLIFNDENETELSEEAAAGDSDSSPPSNETAPDTQEPSVEDANRDVLLTCDEHIYGHGHGEAGVVQSGDICEYECHQRENKGGGQVELAQLHEDSACRRSERAPPRHRESPKPKRKSFKDPLTTGTTFSDDGVRRVLVLAGKNVTYVVFTILFH